MVRVCICMPMPYRRISRTCRTERFLDEGLAEHAAPQRIAELAVVVPSLVDDVPGNDLPAVVGHQPLDVIQHGGAQIGRTADRGEPRGELIVPEQRVALYGHAVRLREVDGHVRLGKGEVAARGLGRVPLHLVFGRHVIELAGVGDVIRMNPTTLKSAACFAARAARAPCATRARAREQRAEAPQGFVRAGLRAEARYHLSSPETQTTGLGSTSRRGSRILPLWRAAHSAPDLAETARSSRIILHQRCENPLTGGPA